MSVRHANAGEKTQAAFFQEGIIVDHTALITLKNKNLGAQFFIYYGYYLIHIG